MIGVALHMAARGLDTLRAEASEVHRVLGWCLAFAALGRGTPDPSEVEQLANEVDLLRDERDKARAQLADAQTLAHEAKLEFSAAREACEQLRGELATVRKERDELLEAAADAVAKGQLFEEGTGSLASARDAGSALAKLCLRGRS